MDAHAVRVEALPQDGTSQSLGRRSSVGTHPNSTRLRFVLQHHIAPQAAISTTFVHPVEYAMFSTSVMLPAALLGLPVGLFSFPLAWGMLTGCGAHSGYSGKAKAWIFDLLCSAHPSSLMFHSRSAARGVESMSRGGTAAMQLLRTNTNRLTSAMLLVFVQNLRMETSITPTTYT